MSGDPVLVSGRGDELARADGRSDLARERADHAEGGVVDADRPDARDRERLEKLADHVPASRDRDDVDLALAVLVRGVADDLPVEDGLVERHRNVVLGLEADGGLELVAVVDRGQAHRADGDALVGDADPHLAAELLAARSSSLIAWPSASGSATSPSRKIPGPSGMTPPPTTSVVPLTRTSVAATLPVSISRPTTDFAFCVVRRAMVSCRGDPLPTQSASTRGLLEG